MTLAEFKETLKIELMSLYTSEKEKELISIIAFLLCVFLIACLGLIYVALTFTARETLIDKELAEYRIDPKTGKKEFHVFTREEILLTK